MPGPRAEASLCGVAEPDIADLFPQSGRSDAKMEGNEDAGLGLGKMLKSCDAIHWRVVI